MAQVTCARCFAVHDSDDARPGAVPACPACARVVGVSPPLPEKAAVGAAREARRGRRIGRWAAAAIAIGALGFAAVQGLPAARRRLQAWQAPPAERHQEAVALAVEAWRAEGRLPPSSAGAAAVDAGTSIAAGQAALAADLPARARSALADFRAALAADPARADAVAGYVTALVEARTELLDGGELLRAHEVLREARGRKPEAPGLLAAYARLLLAVPSASNLAEAGQVASQALAAAPGDAAVQLAAGLADAEHRPGPAAAALLAAARAHPADRRLLSAAARARWAAGDAPGARALARERLALDPDQPAALELLAEVEAALDRPQAARAALDRWAASDPAAATPLVLAARTAYQLDTDLGGAAHLLDQALARRPDDFQAARALAHRAAVARARGDAAGARAAVAQALRLVPGSGPARFQAALLAFDAGDAAALRESAGVVGEHGGPRVEKVLAARAAELRGPDEAEAAYVALGGAAAQDPAELLAASGGLLRAHLSGPALRLAEASLRRDPVDARLRRAATDYWEGPAPLSDAARQLAQLSHAEPGTAPTALAGAAAAELILGHTREAERLARAAQLAAPQAAPPLALRAQVALDTGDPTGAARLAQAALQAGPGEPLALAVAARAAAAVGRKGEAERLHRAALAAVPDLAGARLDLARLLEARGARAEARDILVSLVRDEPEIPAARAALAAQPPDDAPPAPRP